MMKRFARFVLCLTVITASQPLLAGPIAPPVGDLAVDFRTPAWSGANNQFTWAPGGGSVQAKAFSDGPLLTPGRLYQDADDGLGILGGENDEINHPEMLRITFTSAKWLDGVWLTDLFAANDGIDNEEGKVVITLDDFVTEETYTFTGEWPLGSGNGEQYVSFGSMRRISKAEFYSINQPNDEYSVAGFTSAIPAPGAIVLGALGTGLVGWMRRRRTL